MITVVRTTTGWQTENDKKTWMTFATATENIGPKNWEFEHASAYAGQLLTQTNATKFLGVYIDEHLTWKGYISYLCKQISKSIRTTRQFILLLYDQLRERIRWTKSRAVIGYPSGQDGAVPQGKFIMFWCFIPYNKSFIDQACSVKMAGYWPSSFFACSWTETKSVTHIYHLL